MLELPAAIQAWVCFRLECGQQQRGAQDDQQQLVQDLAAEDPEPELDSESGGC